MKQKFFLDIFCDTIVCKSKKRKIFVKTYDLYDIVSYSVSKVPITNYDSEQHSPGEEIRVFPS